MQLRMGCSEGNHGGESTPGRMAPPHPTLCKKLGKGLGNLRKPGWAGGSAV